MTWIWLVSKIECLSMGMDGREQRSLGKLWHFWEGVTLHSAGVGHFLLPTINANFFFCIKSDMKHDRWCLQCQNTGVGIAVLVYRL